MEFKRLFGEQFYGAKPHAHYVAMLPSLLRDPIGPIYVVDAADLGQEIIPDCYGMTGAGMALTLQPFLESCGRWRGAKDAFACIMATDRYRQCLPHDAPLTLIQEALRAKFAGILLHEFAHYVEFRNVLRIVRELGVEPGAFDPLPEKEITCPPDDADKREIEPWRHHAWTFIRAGLHLAHRANVPAYALALTGKHYETSPVQSYESLAADEVEQRQDEPLSTILADPPPPGFCELFDADCRRYRKRKANERNAA